MTKYEILQTFLSYDFKKEREEREARSRAKKEEDMKLFLAGPTLESTIKCMRYGCPEMRWKVPTTESVLCPDHTLEVLRGEARAPPLRARRDYISVGRKTFLVEQLPETFPITDAGDSKCKPTT